MSYRVYILQSETAGDPEYHGSKTTKRFAGPWARWHWCSMCNGGLVHKNLGERHAVACQPFSFHRAGARIIGGWWQMIIGGLPFDIEGLQDSKSDSYAKLVAEYIGVEYKG